MQARTKINIKTAFDGIEIKTYKLLLLHISALYEVPDHTTVRALPTDLIVLCCSKLTTPTEINIAGISISSINWMVRTLRQRFRSLNIDRQPTILSDT